MARLVEAIHTGVVTERTVTRNDDLLKLFMIAHRVQVEHSVKQCEEMVTKRSYMNILVALDLSIEGELRSSNAFVDAGIQILIKNPECLYSVPKPDRYKDMTPAMIEMVKTAMARRIDRI